MLPAFSKLPCNIAKFYKLPFNFTKIFQAWSLNFPSFIKISRHFLKVPVKLRCNFDQGYLLLNKTGTSQVGAISKAQKAQNIFLEKKLEIFKKKFLSENVAQCRKMYNGGPFLIYKHSAAK